MPRISRANLFKLLAVLFIVFASLGWAISSVFSKYNSVQPQVRQETVRDDTPEVTYEGTITYVDPRLNPADGISFSLMDPLGNEVILLKSNDQKLEVSEGHRVTAFGMKKKTSTGKDYLLVSKVVIKNGTN